MNLKLTFNLKNVRFEVQQLKQNLGVFQKKKKNWGNKSNPRKKKEKLSLEKTSATMTIFGTIMLLKKISSKRHIMINI